ncbi:MAG TPA: P1 family peptidase [Thermoanaerobaculia bacterium]|jgi:L-aminopeptidase/D-esterase-like protein
MPAFPPGYRIGHRTLRRERTGCTVILPPAGTIAAVDVRGGAPGTRETGVFVPGNLVSEIHGLLFTGGSAFGLAAAAGVAAWLRREGAGFPVGPSRVPIVPAAVLFDLAVGDADAFPGEADGWAACEAAREGEIETGSVGAGCGATVGKVLGVARSSPGGVGCAALELPGGERVAALSVVNAFGDVVDPDTGARIAGAAPENPAFRAAQALWRDGLPSDPAPGGHTTLLCIATTVPFEPGSLKRVAMEAHDGIARAVRPSHSVVDGDVVFALAPSGPAPAVPMRLRIGAAAAEAAARAIVDAVAGPSRGAGASL